MTKKQALVLARQVALTYLGKPYLWGGDDPMAGFDCSGFVIEVLKSVGLLPREGDWTAAMLYDHFIKQKAKAPAYEGCLVFYANTEGNIVHVEYVLNDTISIGASGGGSATDSLEDAIKQNAYIKLRAFKERPGIYAFVDPFSKLV